MQHSQLLPIYQRITGLPGSDDAYNRWVQGIIDDSGSGGTDAIPDNYFDTPQGQSYVQRTTTTPPAGVSPGAVWGGQTTQTQAPSIPQQPFDSAPTFGGNYATSQIGGQSGAYDSSGMSTQDKTSQQTQNTQQNQTTDQTQSGTSAQSGTSVQQNFQNTAGTQQSTGQQTTQGTSTSTSGVNAPFDVGSLVNTQLGQAGTRDATATNFLTDFVNTGGTTLNSQVDQAVRRSLTGPQMSGAGDSARARAAGYAGAEIARNNAGQRLQAAGQLVGPNATASTLGAITPLLGQTNTTTQSGQTGTTGTTTNNQATTGGSTGQTNQTGSTTGQTTGSAASTGSSNTLDIDSLISNEAASGTATGLSSQKAGGLVPQGQPVSSGGCVVCTAYVELGLMKPGAIRRAALFKRAAWKRYGTSLTGYLALGPTLVRPILRRGWFSRWFRPVARTVLYHEVYLSAPTRVQWRLDAYITHGVFDVVFWPVGVVLLACGRRPDLRDPEVKALTVKHNLNFEL